MTDQSIIGESVEDVLDHSLPATNEEVPCQLKSSDESSEARPSNVDIIDDGEESFSVYSAQSIPRLDLEDDAPGHVCQVQCLLAALRALHLNLPSRILRHIKCVKMDFVFDAPSYEAQDQVASENMRTTLDTVLANTSHLATLHHSGVLFQGILDRIVGVSGLGSLKLRQRPPGSTCISRDHKVIGGAVLQPWADLNVDLQPIAELCFLRDLHISHLLPGGGWGLGQAVVAL